MGLILTFSKDLICHSFKVEANFWMIKSRCAGVTDKKGNRRVSSIHIFFSGGKAAFLHPTEFCYEVVGINIFSIKDSRCESEGALYQNSNSHKTSNK